MLLLKRELLRCSGLALCHSGKKSKLTLPRSRSGLGVQFLPMRKVILGLGISLDGYIARPDGAVDFLFMPKDYSMAPFFRTIDTAIMGRKTLDDALQMGGGSFG